MLRPSPHCLLMLKSFVTAGRSESTWLRSRCLLLPRCSERDATEGRLARLWSDCQASEGCGQVDVFSFLSVLESVVSAAICKPTASRIQYEVGHVSVQAEKQALHQFFEAFNAAFESWQPQAPPAPNPVQATASAPGIHQCSDDQSYILHCIPFPLHFPAWFWQMCVSSPCRQQNRPLVSQRRTQ